MIKLLQRGNAKLGKSTLMWNMTTSTVQCGRACKGCYSAAEEKRWPNVRTARQKRYEASLQLDFVALVKSELSSLKTLPKYLRIHASSEFYDQPYVNKWHSIASAFPTVTFFAYTKRLKDFDFTALKSLSNVCIIDSFHFGGLNYGKITKAPTTAFVCPDQKGVTNVQCGETCTYCMVKGLADTNGVYFVEH
jgi:hypothetical protein